MDLWSTRLRYRNESTALSTICAIMADVDPELLVVREEYEQVVGKTPGPWNKNDIDLMRKKIEKVKAKIEKDTAKQENTREYAEA